MEDRHAPHGSACTDVLSVSLIGATGLRDVRPWGKGLNMGESAAPVPATQSRLLSRRALPRCAAALHSFKRDTVGQLALPCVSCLVVGSVSAMHERWCAGAAQRR